MDIEDVSQRGKCCLTLRDIIGEDGRYLLELVRDGEKEILTPEFFDTDFFVDNFTYSGDDLGASVIADTSLFKLWAPTAWLVTLNLFRDGSLCSPYKSIPMERESHGVWSVTEKCGSGTYYTYTITNALGEKEAVDPYAKALGVNGNRGMVIDLLETDPDGFGSDTFVNTVSEYSDAVIWETHVRDFSIKNEESDYKGKFLAFTERGLRNSSGIPTGIDYLVKLGITHVQLLPVFDYATVNETAIDGQYNWGYDPKNYNAPEGSYSTDPYHGEVRIREFKEAVEALHKSGIGVVMDVVYNHTYSTDSSFERIVPHYYYRYNPDGTNSNGSGCGNETASNRVMFRKFMVDSLLYWATEYHIDGFRFDLMGVHDIKTMKEIEEVLHKLNPRCLIYGEGWTGGPCAYDYSLLAGQANISSLEASAGAAGAIAVFNDTIRDGLKGSVFSISGKGYINGDCSRMNAEKVAMGIRGESVYGSGSHMVVNYMSAHDNNTLWDKLTLSNPNATKEELLEMNRLGAAIIMVSNGMPFMLSGEEVLRTKHGDGNSYKSPDTTNNFDWNKIEKGSDEERMFSWYKKLMEMRKRYHWLRNSDVRTAVWDNNSIFVTYSLDNEIEGIGIINPTKETFLGTLPEGKWKVILDGDKFLYEKESVSVCISVPARGIVVLTK